VQHQSAASDTTGFIYTFRLHWVIAIDYGSSATLLTNDSHHLQHVHAGPAPADCLTPYCNTARVFDTASSLMSQNVNPLLGMYDSQGVLLVHTRSSFCARS